MHFFFLNILNYALTFVLFFFFLSSRNTATESFATQFFLVGRQDCNGVCRKMANDARPSLMLVRERAARGVGFGTADRFVFNHQPELPNPAKNMQCEKIEELCSKQTVNLFNCLIHMVDYRNKHLIYLSIK